MKPESSKFASYPAERWENEFQRKFKMVIAYWSHQDIYIFLMTKELDLTWTNITAVNGESWEFV